MPPLLCLIATALLVAEQFVPNDWMGWLAIALLITASGNVLVKATLTFACAFLVQADTGKPFGLPDSKNGAASPISTLPGDRAAAARASEARKVRAPRNNGAG